MWLHKCEGNSVELKDTHSVKNKVTRFTKKILKMQGTFLFLFVSPMYGKLLYFVQEKHLRLQGH